MQALSRSLRAAVLAVLLPAWLLSLLVTTDGSALAETADDTAVGDLSVAIHTGTCSAFDQAPAFALSKPALAGGDGDSEDALAASYSELATALANLLAAPHALVATSAGGEMVACGDVAGQTAADGSLIVGMVEVGGSDVSGLAFFAPTAAGTAVSLFVGEDLVEDEDDHEDGEADDEDGEEDENQDDDEDEQVDGDLEEVTAGLYEGTCDALGDQPVVAFPPLGEVQSSVAGASVATLPLSADQLGSGDYAIVVGFGDGEASCGEVTGATLPSGELLIGLHEEGDSDLSGFVLLGPSGAETVATLLLAEDLSEGDHDEAESEEEEADEAEDPEAEDEEDDEEADDGAGDEDEADQDEDEEDEAEDETGDEDDAGEDDEADEDETEDEVDDDQGDQDEGESDGDDEDDEDDLDDEESSGHGESGDDEDDED